MTSMTDILNDIDHYEYIRCMKIDGELPIEARIAIARLGMGVLKFAYMSHRLGHKKISSTLKSYTKDSEDYSLETRFLRDLFMGQNIEDTLVKFSGLAEIAFKLAMLDNVGYDGQDDDDE